MLKKKVFSFAFGSIGGAVLSFITLPIVTWFFSKEDIGRLNILQVTLNLSVTLFTLAMNQAYVREYHEVNDKGVLLKSSTFPGLVILLVSIVMLAIFPVDLSGILFGETSKKIDFLVLLGVLFSFFIFMLAHVLRMQERGFAYSLTQILPRFTLLFFIGVMVFFQKHPNYNDLIFANTMALFISFLTLCFLIKRDLYLAFNAGINVELIKNLLKFSLPLVMGSLAYWALTTMDRFFLRSLTGFDELGLYSIASSIAAGVTVFSSVFSNIWHPTVYKWAKEGVDPVRVQSVIENMLLIVVIIWSIVGALSWVITFILPNDYVNVQYLIVGCVAMPLLYMLSETTVVGIGISRKSTYAMFASVGALIVNVSLNYLLIPHYGASGAVIASAMAFFVFFIIRTESSCYLWFPLPRMKIYTCISVYVFFSICVSLLKLSVLISFIVWLGLMLISLTLFKDRFFNSVKYFLNK